MLGDFNGLPDEGMKNISHTLKEKISCHHNLLTFGLKEVFYPKNIFKLRNFNLNIIHYLHGPTLKSLILLKILKLFINSKVKIIITATRPYFSKESIGLIKYILPDLVLTQSLKFEKFFQNLNANTFFFPNGVDCDKFKPINKLDIEKYKLKYSIPLDKTIVLHVGHIKKNRQLEVFKEIQKLENIQVVIVGGTHQKSDEKLKKELLNEKIIVIHQYIKDISVLYNLSDIYIFPIIDIGDNFPNDYNQVGAIDLPLSIFEAMACNLFVITSKFGALQRLFKSGGGLNYIENESEIIEFIHNFNKLNNYNTRDKVIKYNWDNIIIHLNSMKV